jgi:ABC-type Co2+ transport system permease subunit
MAGVYAFIGIGEGMITAAVLSLIMATRADLLELQKA